MITDPISDMLTRIRNGYLARKGEVTVPHSRFKADVLTLLNNLGYVESVKKIEEVGKHPFLKVVLKYKNGVPAMTAIDRVSKPSLRVYRKGNKMPLVLSGMGHAVVSTSQGLMTARDAKKKNLGGELILRVY